MTQVYGYAVCLVAVITFLISVASLVTGILDYSDPLQAGWPMDKASLAFFEIYKVGIIKSLNENEIPDDQTLMAMYEAAKTDKIRMGIGLMGSSVLFSTSYPLTCNTL